MADEEINDQTLKSSPVDTDELWLESSGETRRTRVSDIRNKWVHARGRVDNLGSGNLKTGSVGIASINQVAPGQVDVTLENPVTNVNTALVFLTSPLSSGGGYVTYVFQSTTVIRVYSWVSGSYWNGDFSILVFDEA